MNSTRLISILVLVSLLGLFGVAFLNNEMEHDGHTANPCPYSQGMNSMCPMTVAHHAQTWLSLFLAIPTETFAFLSLVVFAVLIIFTNYRNHFQGSPSPGLVLLSRFTRESNASQSLFSYFILLFRLGILHSKVF